MKMKLALLIGSMLAWNGSTVYAADMHNQVISPLDLISELIQNPPTLEQLEGIRPVDLLSDDGLTEIAEAGPTIGPIDLYAYCVVESEFRNMQKKHTQQSKADVIGKIKKVLAHSAGEDQYADLYKERWLPAYNMARRAAEQ